MIFRKVCSEILFCIPLGVPILDNTDSKAVRIDFLSHNDPPYFSSSTTVIWLLRFRILYARPCALGWILFIVDALPA